MKIKLSAEMRDKCFKALADLRFKMAVVMVYPNHKDNEFTLINHSGKSLDMLDIRDDETFWEIDKHKDLLIANLPSPYYEKHKVIFTDDMLRKISFALVDHAKIVWNVTDKTISMYDIGTKETIIVYDEAIKMKA